MTPDEHTIQELFLDVGDGHQLYIQDWGNPKAKTPILYLHGGPGSGVKDKYKLGYEPDRQRVIFFDQRASGKSLPYGSLENNTTADLIGDIEKLADHLHLTKFVITGASWGSCLALTYAIRHPEHVSALVLRGIFTGTMREIEWLEKGRYRDFFPDVWERFCGSVPRSYASDPAAYHTSRILGRDADAARESAYAVGDMEGSLLSIDDRHSAAPREEYDPTFVKIETHYMDNACFLPDNYIKDNVHKLKMPVWMVQGRYDMVCPPTTAYELHKNLPNSRLIWTVAGHANDRANYDVTRTILLQLAG